MSRLDKLIARFRSQPPEADFDDVRRLLEAFGWTLDRIRGSHCHFVKDGELPLTIPKHGGHKVKRTYIVMICERLQLDDPTSEER